MASRHQANTSFTESFDRDKKSVVEQEEELEERDSADEVREDVTGCARRPRGRRKWRCH